MTDKDQARILDQMGEAAIPFVFIVENMRKFLRNADLRGVFENFISEEEIPETLNALNAAFAEGGEINNYANVKAFAARLKLYLAERYELGEETLPEIKLFFMSLNVWVSIIEPYATQFAKQKVRELVHQKMEEAETEANELITQLLGEGVVKIRLATPLSFSAPSSISSILDILKRGPINKIDPSKNLFSENFGEPCDLCGEFH